eukprot:scaffold6241_cov129-Cylindrotheca_fusiformis.AAC.10
MRSLVCVCLFLAAVVTLVEGWSIRSSKVVISIDDFKSTQPMTTKNLDEWIPWKQGEIDTTDDYDGTMEKYIEGEYRKWLETYNKRGDPRHFATFKQNFLTLLEEAEDGQGGQPFFQLNQFGDMTQQEHQREMIILEAYCGWCGQYGKQQDPRSFQYFKVNLLEQVRLRGQIDEEIHLGEFADRPGGLEYFMDPLRNAATDTPSHHLLSSDQRIHQDQRRKEIGNGVFVESNNMLPEETPTKMPNFIETMQDRIDRKVNRYTSDLHP